MEIAKERVGKMKPTIISGWIAAGDGGGGRMFGVGAVEGIF
jgi:hypothetical protein